MFDIQQIDGGRIELRLSKLETFEKLILKVSGFYVDLLGSQKSIAMCRNSLKTIAAELLTELEEDLLTIMEILSFVEIGNRFVSHSLKTAVFSVFIARAIGFSEARMEALIITALLHDIGRLKLPSKFSFMTNDLKAKTPKEKEMQHTVIGYRILREDFRYPENIASIVLNHHEQLDGQGYPKGLTEKALSKADRILFTANFIDEVLEATKYNGLQAMISTLENAFNKYPKKFDGEIVVKLFAMLKNASRIDRKQNRFGIYTEALFRKDLNDKAKEFKGRITDLSSGGVRMMTPEKINIGESIYVSFNLGAQGFIRNANCLVMRVDSVTIGTSSLGLKFIELNPESQKILDEFIKFSHTHHNLE